jgi:hypothetical protein
MRVRRFAVSLVVLGTVLSAAARLRAQTPATAPESSFVICGQPYDATHPWAWPQVSRRYATLIAAGDFKSVYRQLAQAFELSPNQRDEGVRRTVAAHIARVASGAAGARQELELSSVFDPGTGARRVVLLSGAEQIDLSECGTSREDKLGRDELRYLAQDMVALSDLQLAAARGAAFERIEQIEERYDRYLFKGFPMFPWESWLNGLLLAPEHLASGPPHHQIVAVHPGAGVEATLKLRANDGWNAALALEPIGWIYYPPSKDFRVWWGASALLAFRRDIGMGAGVLFHYQNFSLGLVLRPLTQGGSLRHGERFVFLGIDAYQFLKKKPAPAGAPAAQ